VLGSSHVPENGASLPLLVFGCGAILLGRHRKSIDRVIVQ
jgi:hypothetical protein